MSKSINNNCLIINIYILIIFSVINESLYQHIIEVIPVSQEECNVYHMVAMTGSGVRLYFTTGYERSRPFKLQMMHIRLPPGYSPRSSHNRPSQAHTALYKKGIMEIFFLCSICYNIC